MCLYVRINAGSFFSRCLWLLSCHLSLHFRQHFPAIFTYLSIFNIQFSSLAAIGSLSPSHMTDGLVFSANFFVFLSCYDPFLPLLIQEFSLFSKLSYNRLSFFLSFFHFSLFISFTFLSFLTFTFFLSFFLNFYFSLFLSSFLNVYFSLFLSLLFFLNFFFCYK